MVKEIEKAMAGEKVSAGVINKNKYLILVKSVFHKKTLFFYNTISNLLLKSNIKFKFIFINY